jgi:hypothetical protein
MPSGVLGRVAPTARAGAAIFVFFILMCTPVEGQGPPAVSGWVVLADAAADKKPTPHQERMTSCNAQATEKNLKGDERKTFMSDCLKAKPVTQQERMTACNKDVIPWAWA